MTILHPAAIQWYYSIVPVINTCYVESQLIFVCTLLSDAMPLTLENNMNQYKTTEEPCLPLYTFHTKAKPR